jgi:hypothetical protein
MEVTIEQKQRDVTRGWIFKNTETFYDVIIQIGLSDQEQAVLNKIKAWDSILYEIPNDRYEEQLQWRLDDLSADPDSAAFRRPSPVPRKMIGFTIEQFCNHTREFTAPGAAKNFAEEARTHLKKLKDIIDHNADAGPKIERFKL